MSHILEIKENKNPVYSIQIEVDYLKLKPLTGKKICIVTDDRIGPFYLEKVAAIWRQGDNTVITHSILSGEEHKNLATVQALYEHLIQARFERNDMLVALGGGVIGDLTGFTAATYLRGIDFIQMPTTLLAMVDSSIGGKTGVDFSGYKNMVGAFHQPAAVYMNLSVLHTLTEAQYRSGFGEIIKYGLLKDKAFYLWLKEHREALLEKSLPMLEEMIYKSCRYKQIIVEKDPKEKGERALLNLGHTIGHAIEKLMDFKLLHGECVAVGTVAAAYLSCYRGYLSKEEALDIRQTFISFGLPTSVSGLSADTIVEITKSDKKMAAGKIKFILLKSIGNAFIDTEVTEEEMKLAISGILT